MKKLTLILIVIAGILSSCSKEDGPITDPIAKREVTYQYIPGGSTVSISYLSIEQNRAIGQENVKVTTEYKEKLTWNNKVSLTMLSDEGLTSHSVIRLMYKDRVIKELRAKEGDRHITLEYVIKESDVN